MSLAAHWLNQTLTLYRSGDAMASCELKINSIASELLKEHETILTRARCKMLTKRLAQILFTAIAATLLYWYTMWQVQPLESATQALLLWRIGLVSAAIANLVAAINLYRFLTFPWPTLHTVIVTQASGTNAA